jgi:hypothetical protein
VVVRVTDARSRLQAALGSLAADATDLMLAHCDLHASKGAGSGRPGCGCGEVHGEPGGGEPEPGTSAAAYVVAPTTACAPAHLGPGRVRVGVPAPTGGVELVPVTVVAVRAGSPTESTYGAKTADHLQAGQDHVEVDLDPALPRGSYVGRVTDASGAVSSAFVIYLDGLQ